MIRKASKEDIPALNLLLGEVLKVHYAIRPDIFKAEGVKYNNSELELLLDDGNRFVFVYEENDKILGHIFLEIREHNENVLVPYKTLHVDDLCVLDGERGKGIGKALMEYAFKVAKMIGAKDITLNVWNKNENALKFYESLGMSVQRYILEKSI